MPPDGKLRFLAIPSHRGYKAVFRYRHQIQDRASANPHSPCIRRSRIRADNEDANDGKHGPRDKNSVDDGVSQTVVHARMLFASQQASKRALAHSFR